MKFNYTINEDSDLYLKNKETCEIRSQDAWEAMGYDTMDDIFVPVFYEGLDEDGDEVWS